MRYGIVDHNNTIRPIVLAMNALGHSPVNDDPEIILIDHDSPEYYRNIIKHYPDAKVILYPHGEPYMFAWDGIWPVNPRTDLYLSSNEGAAEIMKRYGYEKTIRVIGWFRGQQKKWSPPEQLERVLFAPIHPLNSGYLNKFHKQANIKAYKALLNMPIKLIVRHIGNIPSNGLWPVDGVEFISGKMDGSITAADLVVSNIGTYLTVSVAQGTPVVAFGQDYAILDGYSDDTLRFSQHWDEYREFLRYPYDVENGYQALLEASENEAVEWRDKFIGDQFTVEKLGEALKCLNIY